MPLRDAATFTAFYREHYPKVVAYVRRRTPADPEAVAAAVFTIAWEKYGTAISLGLPWLYRTAHWELQNHRRSQQRAGELQPDPEQVEDQQYGEDQAQRVWVRAMLNQLPATDQEVLKLLYWEDLDQKSAALVLGCPPGTVAVRAHRARKRLEKLINTDTRETPRPTSLSRQVQGVEPGANRS